MHKIVDVPAFIKKKPYLISYRHIEQAYTLLDAVRDKVDNTSIFLLLNLRFGNLCQLQQPQPSLTLTLPETVSNLASDFSFNQVINHLINSVADMIRLEQTLAYLAS